MTSTQRVLITTYIPLTFLILFFRSLYQDEDAALYLMYAVRVAMFLAVIMMIKRQGEQKIIILAFLFTVLSDYFFVFAKTFEHTMANRELYGMIGFIAAYVCLIAAFHKNFKIGVAEIITAIPFAGIYIYVFIALQKYIEGFMYPAAVVLGLVLCFASWTMVSTLYRGYFSKKSAWMIALAGCVLFMSDMAVAYSMFHPDFRGFILWKENFIWGTYMPGWILLMLVVAEDQSRILRKIGW